MEDPPGPPQEDSNRTERAEATVPSLILQPLLENAVYHGIQPARRGGSIEIRVSAQAGQLQLTVTNPIDAGGAGSRKTGHRLALENIRHRLVAHYGSSAQLQTRASQDRFVANVTLPLPAQASCVRG